MTGKNREVLTHVKEFNLHLNSKLNKKNAEKAKIAAKKAEIEAEK